jgi:putative tryptophan/tyrosine transport system substrate-binding protein
VALYPFRSIPFHVLMVKIGSYARGMTAMQRRDFITLLGSATTWPLAARAQQLPKMLRVGSVGVSNPRSGGLWAPIEQGLRELGYVEGQNLAVEYIDLNGRIDGIGEGMQELVRRNVDVIVSLGNEIALKSALAATRTLPIVMVALDFDPFALGYVTSLARPSGNVTGLFLQQIELSAKRVQLTRDAFPEIREATVFWDRQSSDQWQAARGAAVALGLSLAGIELSKPPYNYELALAQISADHRNTLIVMISPAFFLDRARLAEFALRHRMRSVCPLREFVEAGGLMSYGVSFTALGQRAAAYVDRIARGAKPTDLPIEQPTKFELVINVKTARALGIDLPPTLLARADEVIE